jgi:hypothetical protein
VVSARSAREPGAVRTARAQAVKLNTPPIETSLPNLVPIGAGYASQFLGDAAPESAPKDSERQQPSKKRQCLETFPALAFPIDVAQIEPERELIQRQSCGDSKEHGGKPAAPMRRRWGARAEFNKPQIADQ